MQHLLQEIQLALLPMPAILTERFNKVGFYQNNILISTDTSAPYAATWNPWPAGMP
jgi:hypothetical protein